MARLARLFPPIALSLLVPAGGVLASPTDDALAPSRPVAAARELTSTAGLSEGQLRQYAAMLGSADADTRKQAIDALGTLSADSLPAIERRLEKRTKLRLDADEAAAAMRAFRHAVGSRRADDEVDIAPGIIPVLATDRDEATVAMAEVLLLLRSLEGLQSREAGLLMALVVPLDGGLWRAEMRRVRARAGLWLLPAMIELRSHADPQVKAWAQYGVRALGMDTPKVALKQKDPHLQAEVVRAYAQPLDFSAMPALVRLVDADHAEVRQAARWVVARFGKNAIWQLREYYEEITGSRASHQWGHEHTARELYAALDRERIESADTALARGMQYLAAGELEAMRKELDHVLARAPKHPRRSELAAGYAALGEARLKADALQAAAAAYRRALRLAADGDPARAHYGAQLAFVQAEISLTRGVVDLDGYRRALALDPEHAAAGEALERLTGEQDREALHRRRLAAGGAIVLLLLFVFMLWRRPAATDEDAGAEGQPA